jgi:hypothetical protein
VYQSELIPSHQKHKKALLLLFSICLLKA